MDPDTRVQPEPREDVTTPPVQGGMHMTTTTAAMHLPTASPEYTEQLTTDQPMEDVRHKANSLVHAPDSNPWPHDNSCFGDISPMHDGPEVIPSPAPPNGSTVVPRECVRERDVSLGNLDLIKTDLGDGYTRREDGSLVFHSDGEARVRVIHDLD